MAEEQQGPGRRSVGEWLSAFGSGGVGGLQSHYTPGGIKDNYSNNGWLRATADVARDLTGGIPRALWNLVSGGRNGLRVDSANRQMQYGIGETGRRLNDQIWESWGGSGSGNMGTYTPPAANYMSTPFYQRHPTLPNSQQALLNALNITDWSNPPDAPANRPTATSQGGGSSGNTFGYNQGPGSGGAQGVATQGQWQNFGGFGGDPSGGQRLYFTGTL